MTEDLKYLSYIDPKDVALRLMRRKMISEQQCGQEDEQ